jgi:protein-disulfide isomerase
MAAESLPIELPDLDPPVTPRDHIQGPADAAVVLVEYGDYECPDCLNAWPIVKQLRAEFGDKLAFVFRHNPVSSIHPHASAAAQAAEAAAGQGKFWEMHDYLFGHQKELDNLDLTFLALKLGLEIYRYQSDYEGGANVKRITDDLASGIRSGVHGTPTFFINGKRYRGKVEVAAISEAIRQAATH